MAERYFTKEGLEKLKQELEELRTAKRQEIAERLHEAASHGDLSENSEYQEVKEAQIHLEIRIAELETTMKNAVVAPAIKSAGGVEVGSKIEATSGGQTHEFLLVGAGEAAPWEGKISAESPLGKAMLGRQKGEIAEIDTPEGKKKYKITDIA
jgi:transcription elongation factor GreA